MIIGYAPRGKTTRVSSDSVWPLRRADGRTWAKAATETTGDRQRKSSRIMETSDGMDAANEE